MTQHLRRRKHIRHLGDFEQAIESIKKGMDANGEREKALTLLALVLNHPQYSLAWSHNDSEKARTQL
jgi:hypothetical protein